VGDPKHAPAVWATLRTDWSLRRGRRLATSDPPAPRGVTAGHLASLLDGREVLAYTNDEQGMRRFARALRANLEGLRAA